MIKSIIEYLQQKKAQKLIGKSCIEFLSRREEQKQKWMEQSINRSIGSFEQIGNIQDSLDAAKERIKNVKKSDG